MTTLKILIVENDQDTLKFLGLILQRSGYEVTEATTMEDGLRALNAEAFDILISDIGLPDGTGWELLKTAPAQSVGLAIAMSGFGLGTDRTKSEAAGFRHHFLKPFDPADLKKILENYRAEVESLER